MLDSLENFGAIIALDRGEALRVKTLQQHELHHLAVIDDRDGVAATRTCPPSAARNGAPVRQGTRSGRAASARPHVI